MAYEATEWVDDVTPINAQNLNNMERGIKTASDTIDEVADFVVELGTGGGWAYRKYKSGYVEMRGRFSIILNAGETAKSTYITFPFAMDNIKVFAQTEQLAWNLTRPVDVLPESTRVKVSYYVQSTTNAQTYYFYLFAMGTVA